LIELRIFFIEAGSVLSIQVFKIEKLLVTLNDLLEIQSVIMMVLRHESLVQ